MFFFLDYTRAPQSGTVSLQQLKDNTPVGNAANTLYVRTGRQRLVTIPAIDGSVLHLLGDPVFLEDPTLGSRLFRGRELDQDQLYKTIRGHYYWFWIQADGIITGNSFGAIFPVYYQVLPERTLVSSASFFLAEKTGNTSPDRRNLLERLLFNYPFFDSTWWTGIKLLNAHETLGLSGAEMKTRSGFRLERHFGSGNDRSQAALEHLCRLFEAETTLFLPETPFGISFTGGFDGRTLLAAARKAGRKQFITYSFGHPESADVTFPLAQTRKLGIPYKPVNLDAGYVQEASLPAALGFMEQTEYNGNLGRPHYQHAARQLAQQVDYLITGNFGSELFRALHQPGVMMTENLIRIFSSPDESWKDFLRQPADGWDKTFFREELDALIADVEGYLQQSGITDPNQRFYYFVINDIFRKYFGPELVMQSQFLNNRTPFLSLRFVQALNDTMWSGVHARLFEKKKSRRMKGQMFYAAFIRSADPELYRMRTSKGYSPADVLNPLRLPLLLGRVARQKFLQREEQDSNSVDAFFRQFHDILLHRINPEADFILQQSGLANSLHAMGADLETAVKLYSISMGWTAAQRAGQQTAPPPSATIIH
ncbi:MAG: hypothetical protein EP344_08525 [Bacteroidetes bacterium]|nr:MAG: hypothetical protein EP344_08525 [Bacteroidota bacterium]